jgi:uncharacterized protein
VPKGKFEIMKIALFGASGNIGGRIAQEALARGHEVTAIVREPGRLELTHPKLKVVKGDILNPAEVALTAAGHDAVISAFGQGADGNPQSIPEAARSLLAGVQRAGVKRLIVVGGAGSLEASPGVALMDTPEFAADWKPTALAHADALAILQGNIDLDWTFVSPAASIRPGERTGQFRTGADQLLRDEEGKSRISMEDFAVAVVDELENPKSIRRRFTVGY